MKKEYKLLDRNLIRHFGKSIVMLDAGMGDRYIKAGKAKPGYSESSKMEYGPPQNKAIFQAPEDKTISEIGNEDLLRYPGPGDKLFPQVGK